jgi:hypothetical protein
MRLHLHGVRRGTHHTHCVLRRPVSRWAQVVLRGSVRLVAEKSNLANLLDLIRTAKLIDHEISISYALSLFASFYSTCAFPHPFDAHLS